MKVQLAKWGNSLAVRIPGPCVRQANLKPGDAVEVEVTNRHDNLSTPTSGQRQSH